MNPDICCVRPVLSYWTLANLIAVNDDPAATNVIRKSYTTYSTKYITKYSTK